MRRIPTYSFGWVKPRRAKSSPPNGYNGDKPPLRADQFFASSANFSYYIYVPDKWAYRHAS